MTTPFPQPSHSRANDDAIAQVIAHVERSISDKTYWKRVCQDVAALFSAKEVFFTLLNLEIHKPIIVASTGEHAAVIQDYWNEDGKATHKNDPWYLASMSLREGDVVTDHDLVPPQEMEQTLFYREGLQKHGIAHLLSANFLKNDSYRSYIGVLRDDTSMPFTSSDKALLRHFSPFFKMAMLAYLEAKKQKLMHSIMSDTWLGQYAFAIMQLNAHADIVHMNDFAKHFINSKEQLSIQAGKFVYEGDKNVANQLNAMVENSCDPNSSMVPHQQLSTLPVDDDYYRLIVLPSKNAPVLVSEVQPTCLLVLQDRVQAEQIVDRSYLQMAFDFSKAEIRVAEGLAHGASVKEIAAASNTKENTVRAQLKSIFAKTGVNSQSTLVRLLVNEASYQVPRSDDYKSFFQTFSTSELYDIV